MRHIHSLLIATLLVTVMGVFQAAAPVKANTSSATLSFTPTSLNFGNQITGTTSAWQKVTIKNTGTVNITLGKLSIIGEFGLSAKNCHGKTLAPNKTCVFSVRFSPVTAVYKTGSVSIPSSASTSPYTVSLSGYGITGTNLLLSPSFDFPLTRPIPWKYPNKSFTFAQLWDCSVSLSPFCSVRFSGNSNNYTQSLIQGVIRAGRIGDKYVFLLSSRAKNIPAGGQYKVEVILLNMYNQVVGSKSVNFTDGTHDFKTVAGTIIAHAQYSCVVFQFSLQKTSGTAWFDDARLISIP
jgi:hypothetical protein